MFWPVVEVSPERLLVMESCVCFTAWHSCLRLLFTNRPDGSSRRSMELGWKVLRPSWNTGSSSSVPAVVAVETARLWRLLFFALNRSAPSTYSTVNVAALLRDGVHVFLTRKSASTPVPMIGLHLMEKKNPLRKVILPPAIRR